jgi:hypothetical protein
VINKGLVRINMAEHETSKQDNAKLSAQVEELNKKIDALNSKLENTEANSAAILAQSQASLAAANAAKSQEIMRQTVSNPTGFIAKEAVQYVIKCLEKSQKSKTQQWMVTRGRGVVESAIGGYISQRLPMLNWYGSSVTGTESTDKYHICTKTSFPVEINTGVPFVGKVALTRVILEVESDINPKTNETSNLKCHLSNEQVNRDLINSLYEDTVNLIRPHKTAWSILQPIGSGLQKFYRFMKRETNFSIPFLILFLLTLFFFPNIPPAPQIWGFLKWPYATYLIFGISPTRLPWAIINGVIWGIAFWAIVRFHLLPGLGKVIGFIRTKIIPPIGHFFSHPYYRWGAAAVVVIAVVLLVLWRIGVFEPPPPLQFVNLSVSNGRVGTPYETHILVKGGKAPYVFSVDEATIPAGIAFNPIDGELTGSPATAGSFPLGINVMDGSKKSIVTNYSLRISPADALIITETNLPPGELMIPYSAQVGVLGGTGPYRWGFLSGTLPPGVVFDATGKLTGTPTQVGTYSFTITVSESSPNKMSFDQAFTLIINK